MNIGMTWKRNILRGFGGKGGNRSIITERGGTGTGGSFRITEEKME